MKLNTNASYKEGQRSGIEGAIRNDRGEWVRSYYGKVHACQVFKAELHAIYTGMGIIRMIHGRKIEVESDSLIVVNLLNGLRELNHPLAPIVEDCKIILRQMESTIKHIRREGNKVADALAIVGAKSDEDLKILNDPIPEVDELLLRDLLMSSV